MHRFGWRTSLKKMKIRRNVRVDLGEMNRELSAVSSGRTVTVLAQLAVSNQLSLRRM